MDQRDFEKLCWLIAITTAMDHFQELMVNKPTAILDEVRQLRSQMTSVDFDKLLRDAKKYQPSMGLTPAQVTELIGGP